MKKEKVIRYVKIGVTCFVLIVFIWFFFVSPLIAFKKNEKTMLNAAKRYFEVNSSELPTGNRIKTLNLTTLYHKSFLKEDLKLPYSSKMCDLDKGWVKVKKESNEYKYYVYLECGALSSRVDHEGPKINLNGEDTITVNRGDVYKELGIKSVVDDTDGNMKTSDVSIDSSKVDTNTIGKYKVTYTIKDSFNNKTVKTRVVNVVSVLKTVVNKDTNNTGIYTGMNVNNYIEFSGMLFRIVGLDSNKNVKIVASEDISAVDYKSLNDWLSYYYKSLRDSSKKYVVRSKYCNNSISDDNINSTECSSYTKDKNLYILSIDDYNRSLDSNRDSYLYPKTLSLLANKKNDKEIYTTRSYFIGLDSKYMSFDINYNFGVRPLITIKGDIKLNSGSGTADDPYVFEDRDIAKAGENLNSRYAGEYITYSGYVWRILEISDDGTTKVMLDENLKDNSQKVKIGYTTNDEAKIYNPNQKGNVGYFINNKVAEYINTNYFVSKNIEVPIYNDTASYTGNKTTKKYKVKLSAPSMYDLFTISNYNSSYWLKESSKKQYVKYVVSDNGTVYYTNLVDNFEAGVKLVGYLDKDCTVKNGKGTLSNPYEITK